MIHKRIFTKYSQTTPQLILHALPSKMSRHLLMTSFKTISGEDVSGAFFKILTVKITIATVHLESLDKKVYRYKQLKLISSLLHTCDTALLMGDFNMDSEENYDPNDRSILEEDHMRQLLSGYVDMWRELEYPKNNPGKTRDTTRNNMVEKNDKLVRIDRIMLKSKQHNWKGVYIEMIGTEVIHHDETLGRVFPSDHFGLRCEIKSGDTHNDNCTTSQVSGNKC